MLGKLENIASTRRNKNTKFVWVFFRSQTDFRYVTKQNRRFFYQIFFEWKNFSTSDSVRAKFCIRSTISITEDSVIGVIICV